MWEIIKTRTKELIKKSIAFKVICFYIPATIALFVGILPPWMWWLSGLLCVSVRAFEKAISARG